MNNKLNISIKKPCAENFKDFLPTDKGSFCISCEREVIDFSKMSEIEIINYFKVKKRKTCGYFREDQLKSHSDLNTSAYSFTFWHKGLIGFSLFSLLSFNNLFSQEVSKEIKTHLIQNIDSKELDTVKKKEKIIVKGTVYDELGTLPGASLVIKDTMYGVITDSEGNFEFSEPVDKDAMIIVSFLGYKKIEIKASEANNINLNMEHCFVTGEVSTNKIYKSKKTFFQKIVRIFSND